MKKLKTLVCAAAFTCCICTPVFAAQGDKVQNQETRAELKEARQEIKSLEEQMKPIRAENKTLSAEFKAMRSARKNAADTGISKEEWKEIKGLADELKTVRAELKESSGEVKKIRQESKAELKEKDLKGGLEYLEKAANVKKERLELMKEANALLEEITSIG